MRQIDLHLIQEAAFSTTYFCCRAITRIVNQFVSDMIIWWEVIRVELIIAKSAWNINIFTYFMIYWHCNKCHASESSLNQENVTIYRGKLGVYCTHARKGFLNKWNQSRPAHPTCACLFRGFQWSTEYILWSCSLGAPKTKFYFSFFVMI